MTAAALVAARKRPGIIDGVISNGKRHVNREENQRYLLNAYRVLLTRARQGMAIFVPPANRDDHTRPPEAYDTTYRYLRNTGIPELG